MEPGAYDYRAILAAAQADERYQRNLDWGAVRRGHPEGTIRAHIAELEENLRRLRSRLTAEEEDKLRLLIHVHDTFKPDARRGVPIDDPRSHASLAAAFLREFCDDADLAAMVQYHDEPFALWRQQLDRITYDRHRFERMVQAIGDWDLLIAFLLIDGCTAGKDRGPLQWLLVELGDRLPPRWSAADLW
jgi:hypothetical protein